MKLHKILDGVALTGAIPAQDVEISGISYDTRTLQPGALFVALPGYQTDGHHYIQEAMDRGAAAVLCHSAPPLPGPWLVTQTPRAALARISGNWFRHPARGMTVIGVTGTNGKTTTTYLLKAVLEGTLGTKVGLIGTNQNLIGAEVIPAHRTTPESWEVQKLLRDMADAGCTHVVMEVSSHALVLNRVDGIRFAAGVFTNLTRDHLDFHKTMDAYRQAKGLLFSQSDRAILNLDDEAGRYYHRTIPGPRITYAEQQAHTDLTARTIRLSPDKVSFMAVTQRAQAQVSLPIPGAFTIYNALGVLACGLALGLPLEHMARVLEGTQGVKGRIEVVPTPAERDYTVMIDYAHTPDALENILTAARGFTRNKLWCVFGCGGDRDRSKRPIMGAIAGARADFVVVTSDNPRTEEPISIMEEILSGMEEGAPYVVEPSRPAAIRYALRHGAPGDVIVLAGKGHETYQEIDGVQHHLDEREVVSAFFGGPG